MNEKEQKPTIRVVNSTWFTQLGQTKTIGIVAGLDTITRETKTYIGIADGYNEEQDAQHILKTGAKISSLELTNFTIISNMIAQKLLDNTQDD